MSTAAAEAPEEQTIPQTNRFESGRFIESGGYAIRQGLLPLVEIMPVPEVVPTIAETFRQLGYMVGEGDELIKHLSDRGIWVWVEEGDIVGMHVKREHGRKHDALIRASLQPEGIQWMDMSWENGSGPYSVAMLPGATPPPELLSALNDVFTAQKEITETAWRSRKTSNIAHRTYTRNT